MKFAHMADCHLGGWQDQPKLKELGLKSFERAIDICINRNIAFILISGDLFNTALPNIDILKSAASILKKAKDHNIDIYVIPGSHDFSPSGKTMLDVLSEAGLITNVTSKETFTIDKTNTKIIGLMGLKGGLDQSHYEDLDYPRLESEQGFKIFMFHTAIEELKPKEFENMQCLSNSELPSNFSYYAGGHVHYILETQHKSGKLVYPGPLFPNNFRELEELGQGGFYIVDEHLNTEFIPVKFKDIKAVTINASNKTPEQVEQEILSIDDISDKILLVRMEGMLSSGSPNDIKFRQSFEQLSEAYVILKNTSKLIAREAEGISIIPSSIEDMEMESLKESSSKTNLFSEPELAIHQLIQSLTAEKQEGEKTSEFENRVLLDIKKIKELGEFL